MNKNLLKQIISLDNDGRSDELEKLLESYLSKEPYNTELWLRLALVEMYPTLADYEKAIQCVNRILEYDPSNIKAILLLAYLQWIRGYTEPELIEQLSSLKSDNTEIQSMIEYSKSLYYQKNEDLKMYEQSLVKSIELYQKHVWNYVDLGRLYLKQGKLNEGKILIQKGLHNVQLQYTNIIHCEDTTDIDEFLKEFYKGTHITSVNYASIQNDLMRY